jgi:hypothetical protein
MLTSKNLRDRLLKHRPSVRRCDVTNLRDLGIIWADYQAGNFFLQPGLTNEQFLDGAMAILAVWDSVWFVEDNSTHYNSGRGPVAILGIKTDGWRVEPHVHHCSWSSTRQKLRTWVAVLQMLRYDKDVGVLMVIAQEEHKTFFDRLVKYGVLFPKGRIAGGLPTGAGLLYTIRGKKQCLGSSQLSAQLQH